MPSTFRLCVSLVISICAFGFANAQDANAPNEESKEIKIPVEMKPFKLTLVDEAEKPVKGVKVVALGVRCDESPGSWIGWPAENGGNNEFVTDDNGSIEMKYPVKFGRPERYIQKTNEQGKVILREIPLKFQYQLFVAHEKLTAKLDKPTSPNPFDNAVQYECDSAELKRLTVQMVPIEN